MVRSEYDNQSVSTAANTEDYKSNLERSSGIKIAHPTLNVSEVVNNQTLMGPLAFNPLHVSEVHKTQQPLLEGRIHGSSFKSPECQLKNNQNNADTDIDMN